jgi:hypothetical protein
MQDLIKSVLFIKTAFMTYYSFILQQGHQYPKEFTAVHCILNRFFQFCVR